MPAHVTVLVPFKPWPSVEPDEIGRLKRLFREFGPISLGFSAIRRFPNVLWLAPEPRGVVDQLTQAVHAAFPGYPPYEGAFSDPTPHLTVAIGGDAILDPIETLVLQRLTQPIQSTITDCAVFALTGEGWRERASFRLGD